MNPLREDVNGALTLPLSKNYTGYTLNAVAGSRTAVNADLRVGSVLQLDPHTDQYTSTYSQGRAGHFFGLPTSGFNTPFVVVAEQTSSLRLTEINTLDGVTANKRTGGEFTGENVGMVRTRVKANCVRGVTYLAPVEGTDYLGPILPVGLYSQSLAAGTALSNGVATEQNYAGAGSSVVIPANTLRAGDIIRGQIQGVVSAQASTDTLTVKVKIGSNIVAVTGAIDIAVSDVFVIDYTIVVRTVGASGTAIAFSLSFNGTSGSAAGAADIPTGSAIASFTLDTTAATTIQVTGTYSATSATCTSNLESHTVSINRLTTAFASKPFALAMETTDSSAAAAGSEPLVLCEILQTPA